MTDRYQPLVSCLCVTEGRPEFMPWLLWCYDRQSWVNRELVVIDSSLEPLQIEGRQDIRVVPTLHGISVASKRNLAMNEARGEIITWFDDDDWQHPLKIERLLPNLNKSTVYAGTKSGWFLDLFAEQCAKYRGTGRRIVFNSGIYLKSAIDLVKFPNNKQKASDTVWLQTIKSRYGDPYVIADEHLFFWISHSENLSNPAGRRRYNQPLDALKRLVHQQLSSAGLFLDGGRLNPLFHWRVGGGATR
ncbi:MAG: glycosyltransferase family A protein [Pseudomonadota bacterium]